MNWLMIVLAVIIAAAMVGGYRKGFLRVLYSLVEWLLVMLFVAFASPYVAAFIMDHTQIPAAIEAHCIERMKDSVNTQAQLPVMDSSTGISVEEIAGNLAKVGISLPDSLAEGLFAPVREELEGTFSNTGGLTDKILEESGAYELIAKKITELAVSGLSYFITFLVALAACCVIGRALNLVNKIPILGRTNQVLGFLAGSLEGLLIVWVLFAVVAACAGTEAGSFFITYIAESPILAWLYQNNLLLAILCAVLFS